MPLPGGYFFGEQVFCVRASFRFASGNKLTHGQGGTIVGPATNKSHAGGVAVIFPGNHSPIDCILADLSRTAPPPLPNGFAAFESVFYVGESRTIGDSFNLMHGQAGEIVGPCECESMAGKGLAVQFPGFYHRVSICFAELSRTPPPPLLGGNCDSEVSLRCSMQLLDFDLLDDDSLQGRAARVFANKCRDAQQAVAMVEAALPSDTDTLANVVRLWEVLGFMPDTSDAAVERLLRCLAAVGDPSPLASFVRTLASRGLKEDGSEYGSPIRALLGHCSSDIEGALAAAVVAAGLTPAVRAALGELSAACSGCPCLGHNPSIGQFRPNVEHLEKHCRLAVLLLDAFAADPAVGGREAERADSAAADGAAAARAVARDAIGHFVSTFVVRPGLDCPYTRLQATVDGVRLVMRVGDDAAHAAVVAAARDAANRPGGLRAILRKLAIPKSSELSRNRIVRAIKAGYHARVRAEKEQRSAELERVVARGRPDPASRAIPGAEPCADSGGVCVEDDAAADALVRERLTEFLRSDAASLALDCGGGGVARARAVAGRLRWGQVVWTVFGYKKFKLDAEATGVGKNARVAVVKADRVANGGQPTPRAYADAPNGDVLYDAIAEYEEAVEELADLRAALAAEDAKQAQLKHERKRIAPGPISTTDGANKAAPCTTLPAKENEPVAKRAKTKDAGCVQIDGRVETGSPVV